MVSEITAAVLTPHPWNTGFTWSPAADRPAALTDEQARAFDRDGVVVVRDVFTPDEVAAVRDEVDRFEAEAEAELRTLDDQRVFIAEADAITFTTHLVLRSPAVLALARHPAFAAIAVDLLGPDVDLYWDQAVYKKPEKPRRFPWHQDNGYGFVEPQQYLTCWVPLTDATLANGCPQVVPGLHRHGTLAHTYVEPLGYECFTEPPTEPVAAEARVGDVVVFSSLTPHLTGPNLTGEVRKAWIAQYAPVGAERLEADPAGGDPVRRPACAHPFNLPVARGGLPVSA